MSLGTMALRDTRGADHLASADLQSGGWARGLLCPRESIAEETVGFTTISPDGPGRSYQLQFTTNLTQPNWTDVGAPVVASDTVATAADAVGSDPQRFYRVALLP